MGPSGKAVELKVASRLRCNNGEVAHDWALAGSGLIMKSWVDVARDVRAGRLVRVLPGGAASPRLSAPCSPQTRDCPSVCGSSWTPWWNGSPLSKRWPPPPRDFVIVRSSTGVDRPASAAAPATPWIPLRPLLGLHDRFISIRVRRLKSQIRKKRPFTSISRLGRLNWSIRSSHSVCRASSGSLHDPYKMASA